MGISLTFCPSWSQIAMLSIFTSQVAGIADVCHQAQELSSSEQFSTITRYIL
jgi:hypothetical protein